VEEVMLDSDDDMDDEMEEFLELSGNITRVLGKVRGYI
jgi:hypothetical protein